MADRVSRETRMHLGHNIDSLFWMTSEILDVDEVEWREYKVYRDLFDYVKVIRGECNVQRPKRVEQHAYGSCGGDIKLVYGC